MSVSMDRRLWLAGMAASAAAAGAGRAGAQGSAANQWFPITGDDGKPVPNTRVAVELAEDMEDLPGLIWGGPASASVRLVEFFDFNCPWCRQADRTVGALMRDDPDLRIGLVNNPILSPQSMQAAKVELAVLRKGGARAARQLGQALYAAPGRIDGPRALDVARAAGFDRAEIERLADGPEVADTLRRQMRLAASLGLSATPSWVIGGAALLGHPGEKTLKRVVANVRGCGIVDCA